ncbi:kunitz-type protease inhibitor 2 [Betta splendens]|uniref:Kunitz-type protease inhibitor 2 n=1 Tax=Betta splendens TaxID=158456 RepID=A0A6P7P1I4_BETSP|nr:kunitz-type protease inhibitor 2 [Betta splendens]
MKKHWFGVAVLCFVVCSGLALECAWDESVNESQSLDPVALNALRLGDAVPGTPETCRSACCNRSDCDLVLVTFPQNQNPECVLVSCWFQNRDQCVLQPSNGNGSQDKVYRKKVDPGRRSAPDGAGETHVAPMLLVPSNAETRETNQTNQTNDSLCRQPVKVGACRAAFPRFFYNTTEQRCRSFIYGGCEGNGNNFDSQEACEETCSGVTGPVLDDPAPSGHPAKALRRAPVSASELCLAEPITGPCRAAIPRWFYNSKTGNCEQFVYGGCGGNKNNYLSQESCVATCTVSALPSAKEPSPGDKELCKADPEAGHCRAAFPRWFFNHRTGNCETFIYGGCGGNENNFNSRESCFATCTGSFDSQGEDRRRRRAAFFLFIALAAVAALLLVALITVSLRRRRLSRRSSVVSDKQELLPEDTHSSLESLSAPDGPKPDVA